MRRTLLSIALILVLALPAFASTRIDINRGWLFRTDPAGNGVAEGWHRQLPSGVQAVNVPHTWNIGALSGYVGKAWYFRRFALPSDYSKLNTELHFGATFYAARVWLNGVEIGRHEGGYTAYS